VIWFKRGVSLMIPDQAKPGLFRRMRHISESASLPAAFLGICALAFVVNLVELGCTIGLPAVYTRLLSLHSGLSTAARYAYLVLYNVVYVLPLGAIVTAYALAMKRVAMTERRAKILKAVSGMLLLVFGLVFLAAPHLLR
jgi:cytochrome c biogenesis protein CcdA